MTTPRIVDCDSHIHEPRTAWRDHIDPEHRADALAIEDDDLGYAWLTWRGRRLYLAEIQAPREAAAIGEHRRRLERGERAAVSYDEALPPEYTDAPARLVRLDGWGVDAQVVFPNWGLLWEEMLAEDVTALCANLRAVNRWMADVAVEGRGRLLPVAHLTLRDRAWAVDELRALGRAGIRLAMVAPSPVDGMALGHPGLDPVWAAFVENGIAPVFHVGNFRPPLDPAWYADDPEPVDKLMSSVMLWVAPAAAVASMALHGAFERHPGLRVGVVELTAEWVPHFLQTLDGAATFYTLRHGAPMRALPLRPSEYLLRQVRVGALAYEQPARLMREAGDDLFMFGSDWPHAEGVAEPLRDYEDLVPDLGAAARDKLFGGNARFLLGL